MPRYLLIGSLFTACCYVSITIAMWYNDVLYAIHLILLSLGTSFTLYKRKALPIKHLRIGFFIIFVLLTEFGSAYLAKVYHTNTIIAHIAIPIETVILGYTYFKLLNFWNWASKVLITVLIFTFIAFSLKNGTNSFASVQNTIFAFIIIPLAVFGFYSLSATNHLKPLLKTAEFWFHLGSLIYFSITFFLYAYLWMPGIKPEWTYLLIMLANIFIYSCYLLALAVSWNQSNSERENER